MLRLKVTHIDWDVSDDLGVVNHTPEELGLPEEIELPDGMFDIDSLEELTEADENEIADYISDTTGWLVFSFDVEPNGVVDTEDDTYDSEEEYEMYQLGFELCDEPVVNPSSYGNDYFQKCYQTVNDYYTGLVGYDDRTFSWVSNIIDLESEKFLENSNREFDDPITAAKFVNFHLRVAIGFK